MSESTPPTPDTGLRASRDAEATREALLAAATEVFAERGFDGARVDAIAARAGVNKAMIHYHFGSKEGLYRAIVASTLGHALERLGAITAERRPAAERLRAFIESFAEIALRRPSFPTMMVDEAISGGRHLDDELFDLFFGVFRLVRQIVEDGIAEGSFRPVDPLLTHLGLIGSLLFFFATEPARTKILARRPGAPPMPDPATFVRHLEELVVRGLAPGAPDPPRRARGGDDVP